LKQLQLIQILRIKALRRVNAAFVAVKAGRVNSAQAYAKRLKATSGNADTALSFGKLGNRSALRFTAR
jgi:hypothetical protein